MAKLIGPGDITDSPDHSDHPALTPYAVLAQSLFNLGYCPILHYQGEWDAKHSKGGFQCTLMNNVLLGTVPSGRGPTEHSALLAADAMRLDMEADPRYQYKGKK